MVGYAPFGGNGPSGGGNEGLWRNLHFFRIYGSPDRTDIVTVSAGEITAQADRVWQGAAGRCSGSLCFVS